MGGREKEREKERELKRRRGAVSREEQRHSSDRDELRRAKEGQGRIHSQGRHTQQNFIRTLITTVLPASSQSLPLTPT